MYTVYILRDDKGKLYKGMTKDLVRRLREHRGGHTATTKKMNGIEVVYTECCDTMESALRREKYLKTAAGRRFLKTKLGP